MANSIPQGSTGAASFVGTYPRSGSAPCNWTIFLGGGGFISCANPGGWDVSSTGVITVPLSAAVGSYTAQYINSSGTTYSEYAFTVRLAGTVEPCDYSIVQRSTILGNAGFSGSYTMTGSVTLAASGDKLDGSTHTYYPATYTIDWGDGSSSGGTAQSYAVSGQAGPSHAYTAPGTYTVTISYESEHGDCEATDSVTGTITILPSVNRWFCEAGECVSHPRVQGSTAGSSTEAECRNTGCGTILYTRYVCVLRGGVAQCVPIQTRDPQQGWHSCEEADCTTPVQVWTRYICSDADVCEEILVTDQTIGFASCEEAGCEPAPLLYWCEEGQCQSGTSAPPGVTTFASCAEANCDAQTRYWCEESEVQSGTTPPEGVPTYDTYQACFDAGCYPEPEVYYWCDDGEVVQSSVRPSETAVGPFSSPPDCDNLEPTGCNYLFYALTVEHKYDELLGDHLWLSLHAQSIIGSGGTLDWNNGWEVELHHSVNDAVQPLVALASSSFPYFHWNVPAVDGVHHFEAVFTKATCTPHVAEANFSVGGPTDPDDPDCPPPYEGAKWYCVSGAPVLLATYEAWLAANRPTPAYNTKESAPCYTPPPPCANTVVFDYPAANATLTELDHIVVHYNGPSPIATNNAMLITFNGTALEALRSQSNPREFVAQLPTSLGEWQGAITLTARLTHESGCKSPLVTRSVFVNGTILDDTRWGDIVLEESLPHDAVQVDAAFDAPTQSGGHYYEFAVSSPVPADSPPPSNPTPSQQLGLAETFARMQTIALGADTPLLGLRDADGNYAEPTADAACRIKAYRRSKRIQYAMAAPLTKIRFFKNADGSDAVLFYALPYIYRLDANGFKQFQNLSSIETLLDRPLLDASVRGSKTYVVAGDLSNAVFVEVDTDAPDADGAQLSQLSTPVGAPARAAFVETMKATDADVVSFLRAYSDSTKSVVYETYYTLDGPETRKRFETAKPIVRLHILGATLAFVTYDAVGASYKIYVWKRGGSAPTLRHTGAEAISFLQLESEAGALCFGLESGDLYGMGAAGSASLLTSDYFSPRGTALYNAGEGDTRVYGGDFETVFWKPDTVFIPLLGLSEGESVVGMERWTQTVVEGVGDPLTGGTPGTTLDSLLMGVHSDTADYILRYQRQPKGALAYEGDGIADIEFSSTLQKAGTVAGI